MKRITLTIVAVLLAVPVTAIAKTGVMFTTPPEATETGHRTHFNVVLFREPRDPTGRAAPMGRGRHPLVVFRSDSGRVVRARAGAVSGEGISKGGLVAFPDKGPWHSTIYVGDKRINTGELDGGFGVGTDIIKTLPPPRTPIPTPSAHPTPSSFPWVWVLSIGAIAAALLVLAARAGLMPVRLRTLFGGGA